MAQHFKHDCAFLIEHLGKDMMSYIQKNFLHFRRLKPSSQVEQLSCSADSKSEMFEI